MPLEHLIDTFNHRFTSESQLDEAPFDFRGRKVFGRFGKLTFTTEFRPIRQLAIPEEIRGHDTAPIFPTSSQRHLGDSFSELGGIPNIVSLDRLGRTVHMLNYLLLGTEEGNLFLHVHPRHILTVSRDHGAYFEDIIRACGLPLRRIVISLTISAQQSENIQLLIDRLRNYRQRGYAIAIDFDSSTPEALIEQFREHFFHRLAPDHVRFSASLFQGIYEGNGGERARERLLRTLRQQDTQVHLIAIENPHHRQLADSLAVDFIEGAFLEERFELQSAPRKHA